MLSKAACFAWLACAVLCHGQTPAAATAAPPGARHTFDSVKRAPDGRVQYLFTTRDAAVTNTVYMGGHIGGRQLLGYAPNTRTLTLSAPGGGELALATGASFTQSAPVAPAANTGETASPAGVASCGTPPRAGAAVASAATPPAVIYTGARSSASASATARRVVVSRDAQSNAVTLQPNEYFFGTQYMYPTRFEVGSYTTTGPNGRVVAVPYVIPRDFRVGGMGAQGSNK